MVPNHDAAIAEALSRVRFIVFNYDRLIEAFLVAAISNTFGRSHEDASRFLREDTIVHPYGSLGRLSDAQLGCFQSEMPERIKTFTEVVQPSSDDAARIADALAWADTIVFLGMAYHAQNLKLLQHKTKSVIRVLGTARGLSDVARQTAEAKIRNIFGKPSFGNSRLPTLKNQTCAELLADEAVTLTASE